MKLDILAIITLTLIKLFSSIKLKRSKIKYNYNAYAVKFTTQGEIKFETVINNPQLEVQINMVETDVDPEKSNNRIFLIFKRKLPDNNFEYNLFINYCRSMYKNDVYQKIEDVLSEPQIQKNPIVTGHSADSISIPNPEGKKNTIRKSTSVFGQANMNLFPVPVGKHSSLWGFFKDYLTSKVILDKSITNKADHISEIENKDNYTGGEILIKEGKLININNKSGTFYTHRKNGLIEDTIFNEFIAGIKKYEIYSKFQTSKGTVGDYTGVTIFK